MRKCILAVLAAIVTIVTADFNATGPLVLRITGKTDSSIDGYANACHASAATKGLCYTAGPAPDNSTDYQFYYNYTFSETGRQPGILTYNGGETTPALMRFDFDLVSNVATALFLTDTGGSYISMDPDSGKFYTGPTTDDLGFTETGPGPDGQLKNVTNFHLCNLWTGDYYNGAIALVSVPPAQNPTCQPVDLTGEVISGGS
ncbi:Uu.00g114720.m01.CDS01 [Anthostomella pinea]|uniref:Uu.00g114720.m01.CDS01 n=1 Tax=Anthostomella pinea TaxID=933095 RepID=A0AAI8YE92_9PEZI|nr:Uu.00g114720.m01.CDS01 [Anthostomella pinea]